MTAESWSGRVRVTKVDGSIRFEEPLSPDQMAKLAAAEDRIDKEAVEQILKAPRTRLGRRLEDAARRSA